ncbi:GAF domain-containing protein [Desulfohalovibrio reitneri]|uniref:GAF domain-containing protein n=1 Tax=Desulfohalovibrio reitneri TaxID=1307759 RepID=UPI0004A6EC3D|nr:GAF domain-containing protein [Desulfohalovibrio reitneri]
MERYKRYYRSLFAAAMAINSSLEFAEVLRTVARQASEALDVKGCSIRLLDRTGKQLLPGTSHGLSGTYMRKGAVEVEKSGVDREVLSGKTVFIEDVTVDERFQYKREAKEEGIVSLLVVPLVAESEAIGVLRFYASTRREFDEEEVEFAQSVAALSTVALENARLHQALKRDYETLTSFEYRIFED